MRSHFLCGLAVGSALLALAGAGAGEAKKGTDNVFKTPEEAFNAAKAAAEKRDYKTLCGTLTEESLDLLAGGLVVNTLLAKQLGSKVGFGKEYDKDTLEQVDKVLADHGITDEKAKAVMALAVQAKKDKEYESFKAVLKKAVEPVKDRCAFVADMMGVFANTEKEDHLEGLKAGKLEGLKVAGDSAAGTVVETRAGKEGRSPLEFRKEGGGWKLHLVPPAKKAKGAPPANG
jgi:hypothetical protein